ncbi:mannitol-1-phosphate 5-dehydrogenase [Ignavigranum ruoffiae]|uniref:mannitol-1-phosphate 5-dehydrogenase n=1 Tax=Ignavigranum ruoffiae TaxID=89093 RepID=UPI0020709C26|nr:mannitol-1-phosphate 5-dehydrogenase [Ignavigranum ruoffiae]UPQ86248.1 mannitol-1-phosphate 5-dehydrogenase [Ignavigranum ruoffiae]
MQAVHFGAGNIGRGFIGEVLFKNGFSIDFVDIDSRIIEALQSRQEYEVDYAQDHAIPLQVNQVSGINNAEHPEEVVEALKEADIVTTAIGPNILPHIAELIAQGIEARMKAGKTQALDIIACENMINGSGFLKDHVLPYLSSEAKQYVGQYIGFPNAAVDRIVPIQHHEDPLKVSVEPFKEWIIDQTQMHSNIRLEGVLYVEDLLPYIERKLFSVNTGHATVAYLGKKAGYETISQAMQDPEIRQYLQEVLQETGALLVAKWGFDSDQHQAYIQKIIQRFQNPHISDEISRVGRTPMRKLGYDERFIRPLRELKERGLPYDQLLTVIASILSYDDPQDTQSVEMLTQIQEQGIQSAIENITGLKDVDLINQILSRYQEIH